MSNRGYRPQRPNNRNNQNQEYNSQHFQQQQQYGYGYDQYQQVPYQQYDMNQQYPAQQQPRYPMNPNARSFNFNPSASNYSPQQFQYYQQGQPQYNQQYQNPQQQQYIQPPPPDKPYTGSKPQTLIQQSQPGTQPGSKPGTQPTFQQTPIVLNKNENISNQNKPQIQIQQKQDKQKPVITDTQIGVKSEISAPKQGTLNNKPTLDNKLQKNVLPLQDDHPAQEMKGTENWEDLQAPEQTQTQKDDLPTESKSKMGENSKADAKDDTAPQNKQIKIIQPTKKKEEPAQLPQKMEDLSLTEVKKEQREQQHQQEEEENEEQRKSRIKEALAGLNDEDKMEHINLVFIGHVDAGKSTTAGQLLILTGNVDARLIEKYEKDAKERNREGWYMAYIMDINEDERDRGKTVEVGRANFSTDNKRYTILDAPGHKNYVPNMIGATTQADVGILLVSARGGEFETGFERGGQTREHAQLAKTLGVNKLLVLVNKLDDVTVALPDGSWDQKRFDQIVKAISPFLQKECGYNVKKDVIFVPVASMTGKNFKQRVPQEECSWYKGPTLFEALDSLDPFIRDPYAPVRLPVYDTYKYNGLVIMGKLEQGLITKGDSLKVMPMGYSCKVTNVYRDEDEVQTVQSGENIRIRVLGIDEDEILPGFVICSLFKPVSHVTRFKAQVIVLELLEHKSIFSQGYRCILHIHSAIEECEIKEFHGILDKTTKQRKPAKFCKSGAVAFVVIEIEKSICIEKFDVLPQLGRFTLRDEGRTVAIGKVTLLPQSQIAQ